MPKMTGGEALAKQLHREGVRVVFGLPGVQLYGAMAALRDEKDIRFILTRHEQATTYMADGYARAGAGFGVALVVPGPGVLNAGAGLSTAYSCSSPVFLVAGQVPRRYLGKDVGVLHEINEQLDVVAPMTKWRKRVLQVHEIPGAVNVALGAALWPKNPLREYLDAADVVFAVGSRCAIAAFQPSQKIVQLDVDAAEIGRNHPVEVGLVGDARATLERLLERLRTDAPPRPSRKREREQLREAVAALDTQEPNHSILAAL